MIDDFFTFFTGGVDSSVKLLSIFNIYYLLLFQISYNENVSSLINYLRELY